jgi:hypothetical protein
VPENGFCKKPELVALIIKINVAGTKTQLVLIINNIAGDIRIKCDIQFHFPQQDAKQ